MKTKLGVILSLAGILVLCLAFSLAMASGPNPPDPPATETPLPPEPVTEEAPAVVEGQEEPLIDPPLLAPGAPTTDLPAEPIQPVEQTDPPQLYDQMPATEGGFQPEQASAGTIEAVVVRSWGACSSISLVWDSLNATWEDYGSIPIHINYNYPGLCSGTITYAALVASGADVVILSDPAGGGIQYSPAEIGAILQYAKEGHHLIGTYLMLQTGVDNRGLAPLFGLQGGIAYTLSDVIATYSYLEPANPLFKKLGASYASSGYAASQVPASGTWTAAALNGARIVATNADQKAAILSYHASNYHATYITNMPEYNGGTADKRILYNAITYDVIDAVVVRSWADCSSGGLIWDSLNATWSSYGSVPIHVRYAQPGLCSGTITYAALVASGADVVILSDPAGGNRLYSPAEISAIQQYIQEGHNLIGTYLLLQNEAVTDNRGLAPLFGLQGGLTYNVATVTPTYNIPETGNPLFKHLTAPYASSGYAYSQVPASGTWTAAALNGARIVAINADQKAAVLAYDAPNYRAVYITNMPEYAGGAADQRFMYNAIRYAVDAVVVRSWGACSSGSLVWDSLNATSISYGSIPVHILYDYHGLCDGTISYAALAASGADVVILSDPAGGNQIYSPAEITAIQQYAEAGHHLVGTYLMFQSGATDNRGLAPLFGLQGGIAYTLSDVTPTYSFLETGSPLRNRLAASYASSGYAASQVPASGTWPGAALNGARIVGINADQKAAILSYHAPNYHATFITNMPEYNGGTADKQFLYNAITYDVVEAVVVRSWGACSSGSLIWSSLNTTWPSYGFTPIHIKYADPRLCTGTISYDDLVASKADVVILSDPAGGNQLYSPAEISAIQQYAQEGHHLVGTYAMLRTATTDNRGLAPLFGLRSDPLWDTMAATPTYNFLETGNPLFRRLSPPYVSSGLNQTQVPNGDWNNGARLVAISTDGNAAILFYQAPKYHAVFITSMPEYGGGASDKQFFYNAILYKYLGFLPVILK